MFDFLGIEIPELLALPLMAVLFVAALGLAMKLLAAAGAPARRRRY